MGSVAEEELTSEANGEKETDGLSMHAQRASVTSLLLSRWTPIQKFQLHGSTTVVIIDLRSISQIKFS